MVQRIEIRDTVVDDVFAEARRSLTTITDDTTTDDCEDETDSESDSLRSSARRVPPLDLSASPADSGRGSHKSAATDSTAASDSGSGVLDDVSLILLKMEQLNQLNEADARSVTSRRSARSDSSSGGKCSNNNNIANNSDNTTTGTSRSNSSREIAADDPANDHDDDENIDLWTVWGNLIKSWEVEMKRRPNCVKELVRRGVPQHFRTIAWQLLANANARQIHDQYVEYLRQTSPYEKIILRDIPRTYPEKEFFKDGGRGQQSLFNVIKSYSIHDREVGYCQGSAFIVGQLLLQMPEEETFAVFVRLMEHYRLRELYKPMMTELGLCMFHLDCIVQEQMPDLNMHFNNMGFDTSMYASSWFLTLFTTTLPLELANRIMDLFLVDGMDAIFRVAIAILQQARIDLLKLDMEGMLKYFQRDVRERYENDHDLLFAVASRVVLNAKRMKKLEKEYLAKRSREQEEAIELRRLRTENRLLRQRIDYLETESSALADRLVRGQVDLAQQADNCLSISHELNILRDVNSTAHRRLEDAYETIRELSSTDVNGTKKSLSETGVQVDDTAMIEHIHALQQELIETHCRKSDLENTVRELKLRIHELESANKRLKESSPESGLASIQEELIRVKMREAESSLSLKEMRQRLAEIESQWTKYMHTRYNFLQATGSASSTSLPDEAIRSPDSTSPTPSVEAPTSTEGESSSNSPQQQTASQRARERLAKFTATIIGAAGSISAYGSSQDESAVTSTFDGMTMAELEDHFMGLKIREADTLAELKEMRQRVMELETQNHVCTNQLKRQDEEMRRVRDEKETIAEAEREVTKLLKEEQRKLMESQSEMKEKNVMQRLKYTEALQTVADLRQHIAMLESKSAEKFAQAQLCGSSLCDGDDVWSSSGKSCSAGADDATSLTSEEMSAFLVDVTAKPFDKSEEDAKEITALIDNQNGVVSAKKIEDNEDSDTTTTSQPAQTQKNRTKIDSIERYSHNKW